jgi:hypothetical protein
VQCQGRLVLLVCHNLHRAKETFASKNEIMARCYICCFGASMLLKGVPLLLENFHSANTLFLLPFYLHGCHLGSLARWILR